MANYNDRKLWSRRRSRPRRPSLPRGSPATRTRSGQSTTLFLPTITMCRCRSVSAVITADTERQRHIVIVGRNKVVDCPDLVLVAGEPLGKLGRLGLDLRRD